MATTANPRVEALKSILQNEPGNGLVRYMLANEYVKSNDFEKALDELSVYLGATDDEGAAYRMQATALIALGRDEEAREAYRRGIEAAGRHNHPSMVSEFNAALDDLS